MTTPALFDCCPRRGNLTGPCGCRWCDCCGQPITHAGHYCARCAAYACDCADWGDGQHYAYHWPPVQDVPGAERAGIT